MSNNKRTGKFYRKNEQEVMLSLGIKPTKNSGSGWIEKEDGQNDYVIAQLKSTDAQSITVKQKDLRILEYNANVSHKLPLFVLQFLNTEELWLMIKPEDLIQIAKYIKTGRCEVEIDELIEEVENVIQKPKRIISSSNKAKDKIRKENENRWRKPIRSAK